MFDLDARVHLDEIELAVLVEEFDGADAEITDLAHRLGHRLADLVARAGIERGRGAFLPDLLVTALQRAVALAEMDGVAFAVAEHLNFDVARPLADIFRDRRRRRRTRPLASARAVDECGRQLVCATRDLHAAPAAAGRGFDQHRIADAVCDLRRFAGRSQRRPPSRAPPECRVSSQSVWPRSCRPSMRMCSALGPMNCTPCSARISAKRAFSDKNP